MKLSKKRIMTTVTALVAAMMISTTAFASSNEYFRFSLYPGEQSLTGEEKKTDTKGYAKVTTQKIYGGGNYKEITYWVSKDLKRISQVKSVTKTGTKNIEYNKTPAKNSKLRVHGKIPNTQGSPLTIEGYWNP